MAFMKDILTHNIPIWEECAATPFVQEVQTGKLPLEKFKRYMIQDSIYLKNYARIYGKAIFHAATLREIQLYYSMLNFVNDTESEVRLDYLKQFCITDDDIELIAPLPENQNYIDFMFEIASHGKNEEILMAVLPCMLSYSYIFRKLAAVPTSRQSRYWDFIKDYADEQYAESCKEWSAFAESHCIWIAALWQQSGPPCRFYRRALRRTGRPDCLSGCLSRHTGRRIRLKQHPKAPRPRRTWYPPWQA